MLFSLEIFSISPISAGLPKECTGIIILVLSETAFLASFTSILYDILSTSTKTGTRPICITGNATVGKVAAGSITSSPLSASPFSMNEFNASKLADEPEFTATACLTPI